MSAVPESKRENVVFKYRNESGTFYFLLKKRGKSLILDYCSYKDNEFLSATFPWRSFWYLIKAFSLVKEGEVCLLADLGGKEEEVKIQKTRENSLFLTFSNICFILDLEELKESVLKKFRP